MTEIYKMIAGVILVAFAALFYKLGQNEFAALVGIGGLTLLGVGGTRQVQKSQAKKQDGE